MNQYYTSIILLSLVSLGILCVLVNENGRIPEESKRLSRMSCLIIALSALAEWTGLLLDGRENLPKWLLTAVKCLDYILTPMAGGALAAELKIRNRVHKALVGILAANAVFQVVACFGGWMLRIDEHHHYSHGPLYPVYVLAYFAVLVLVIAEMILYGKRFRRQNRRSVYAVLVLVVFGICLQEVLGAEVRTAYVALTLGAILLFIHNLEFAQMTTDEHLEEQTILLSTDALTGLLSRHAYSQALGKLEDGTPLPADLAAVSIDVNGLKDTNDSLGHAAGDELICGAARCIRTVFGEAAQCYRTGGDEFIVLTRLGRAQAEAALARLTQEADRWHGEIAKELRLAAGFALASEHTGLSAEKLVIEADREMYVEKAAYYSESGREPRSSRGALPAQPK